ncbi:hypothetical protein [Vitreimonas sp.]|jgi:hypothetical protein|uniref:hypothetical protein n=1 Tax=Vitreimonas sp. TaxID=3069702 RepID=UPI002EDA3C08
MRALVFGILSCLVVAACASPFAASERQYTGVYSESFEHMVFEPRGRDEHWYTGGSAQIQLRAAAPPGSNLEAGFRVCATIMGRLSPRGRYGHLGMFAREIEITQVIDAHPEPCD